MQAQVHTAMQQSVKLAPHRNSSESTIVEERTFIIFPDLAKEASFCNGPEQNVAGAIAISVHATNSVATDLDCSLFLIFFSARREEAIQ